MVDAEAGRVAVRVTVVDGVAVEELLLVEDMAQGVDVAGGEAVRLQPDVVRTPAFGGRPDHVVGDRGRVVRRGLGVERGAHETVRPLRTVAAAAAVTSRVIRLRAPTWSARPSPIGELAVQGDDVGSGHRLGGHVGQ